MIARFGQSVGLQSQATPSLEVQDLSDLMHRRQQLVEIQVAEKNHLSRASKAVDHLQQLEQRITALNAQIQHLGRQQAEWQLDILPRILFVGF